MLRRVVKSSGGVPDDRFDAVLCEGINVEEVLDAATGGAAAALSAPPVPNPAAEPEPVI